MYFQINMTNLRHVLSVGLAAATLAVVLTYVLAGQALLQSPYAEPAHNLFMSLMQGIARHASQSQMHAGPGSESQMQSPTYGIIGNNVLGGPATLPAGGLAAVVVTSSIVLAAAAFVVSWKQKSFLVAGLLAASGIILVIPPLIALANINFAIIAFQGPIVGATFGLVIFGLGVAKGVGMARTAAKTAVT
jgi:hypothetical protein